MKIKEEPPKKCIKSIHLIGDCLICCLWVTSVPQVGIDCPVPSRPADVRICYYCHLGAASSTPFKLYCLLAIGRFHLWATGEPHTVAIKSLKQVVWIRAKGDSYFLCICIQTMVMVIFDILLISDNFRYKKRRGFVVETIWKT